MSGPDFLDEPFRPAQVAAAERSALDRSRPVNYPILEERHHYLLTVHGFDAGGFEATVRCVDVQAMIDAKMRPPGHRKPVGERDERDMLRAVARAKKMVRHAVKQIGCDHLLTLTTREAENTPESLARQWKAFVRRYRVFAHEEFPYVAIPERHPSNPKHWHLHVGIRGRLKLNLARQFWWNVCGGRGLGNVDVQYIKVGVHAGTGVPKGPLIRAEKIARYISKYMTKDLIFAHRPDKKRYWRSEFDMPSARRYWLAARPAASRQPGELLIENGNGVDGLSCALEELRSRLGGFDFMRCSFFMFPDGSGFWLSYNPDARDTAGFATPPPF